MIQINHIISVIPQGYLPLHSFYTLQKPLFHLGVMNDQLFASTISIRLISLFETAAHRAYSIVLIIELTFPHALFLHSLQLRVALLYPQIFFLNCLLQLFDLVLEDPFIHFLKFIGFDLHLLTLHPAVLQLLQLSQSILDILILLGLLIQLSIQLQGLVSEYHHFLLQILNSVIR